MNKKILIVLLTVGLCLPFVVQKAFASASSVNGNGTSNYGSYNYSFSVINEQFNAEFGLDGIGGVSISYPIAQGSSFNLTYNFKDTYTGYVQFTVTSNTGAAYRLDQCVWSVSGGYFNSSYLPSVTLSSTSKQFRVFVYNSTGFTFTIVSPNVNTFNPTSTSFTGYSFGSLTYSLSDVGDIPDLVSKFDLYIPGMSTSLSNIESDIDDLNTNISTLLTYTDGLESSLTSILNGLSSLSDDKLTSFAFYVNQGGGSNQVSFNTDDLNSFSYFTDTFSSRSLSRLDVRFNRSILDGNYLALTFYVESSTDYTSSVNPLASVNVRFRDHSGTLRTLPQSVIYRNSFVSYSGSLGVYMMTYYVPLYLLSVSTGSDGREYQFTIDGLNMSNVVMAGFIYGGIIDSLPYDDQYLSLLNSINNGISNLTGDSYDTSQYDSYDQIIDNLNDNMRDRFEAVDDSLQNNIDLIFVPGETAGNNGNVFELFKFDEVNGFLGTLLNDTFTHLPWFKYILIFGLFLLVLGVFI